MLTNYQEVGVRILLTGLTLPHFCACPKPEPGFPMSYVMFFFLFNDLTSGFIVCFIDINGIVDHHCLTFLFKI